MFKPILMSFHRMFCSVFMFRGQMHIWGFSCPATTCITELIQFQINELKKKKKKHWTETSLNMFNDLHSIFMNCIRWILCFCVRVTTHAPYQKSISECNKHRVQDLCPWVFQCSNSWALSVGMSDFTQSISNAISAPKVICCKESSMFHNSSVCNKHSF